MNEQNINATPEAQAPAEPDFEKIFPLEDFKDTVLVLFKHSLQGGPVSLRIVGNAFLAGEIMKGGRHEVNGANGHAIVFNGNDVLWAECITAEENRQRAIERAKAAAAELEAKAAEEKAAQIAKDKAEAEAAAKALEGAAPKRKGLLSRLKGGSR